MMIDDTYALAIYTSRGASSKQQRVSLFMMIDDTYALAIYTSRGASSKQQRVSLFVRFF